MGIRQLSLTDFRNLRSATLDFDRRLNLVIGGNGSGKTSLLEAIYVLCQAQSFRTHQLKQCINHRRSSFLLFGRFDNAKVGLSRDDQKLEIRIDGESAKKRSELARRSPINIVNADSFVLIDGAPARRRNYLDWCMFHVEPEYTDYWARFQHALKQRNRLLKTSRDVELLDYWNDYLAGPSEWLRDKRAHYAAELQSIIDSELNQLLEGIPLNVAYRQGWPAHQDLRASLQASRERDIRSGFTAFGIHRDDLELTTEGKKIGEVLSRGQGKRVCLALVMAALRIVNSMTDNRVILLIDDLQSELDRDAQRLVYRQLDAMGLQLFISNIDSAVPEGLEAKDFKMFHVEHGTIKPRFIS